MPVLKCYRTETTHSFYVSVPFCDVLRLKDGVPVVNHFRTGTTHFFLMFMLNSEMCFFERILYLF